MNDKTCEICGNELFLKNILENSYEYCCPNCLNFNPLNKAESLVLCKKYIELTHINSLNICKKFSFKDLIYASLNSRELAITKHPDVVNIEIETILWATLIIKDCLKSSFSGNEVFLKENLYQLFSHYRDRIETENLLIEIQEDYAFLFEDTLGLKELAAYSSTITVDGKKYRVMTSWKWRHYIEALETIQLVPDIRKGKIKKLVDEKIRDRQTRIKKREFELVRAGRKRKTKLQQEIKGLKESIRNETYEILYNSFYAIYFKDNEHFFEFNEIIKEDRILNFIDLIIFVSREKLKNTRQNPPQIKKYYEMSIDEFKELCSSDSLNFEEMYSMLVSSKENCKEFPLLIEHETKILVCPEILLLILSFIRFGFAKKEYKSKLSFLGMVFEENVAELFESEGFSLDHPKIKGQRLVGKKINSIGENGREIDLLPYNEKYLFVIECKRHSLAPKYIFESEKELRLSSNEGIKDEIDNKHLSRVQYFQIEQKEFGFKSNRIVKGLIVTLVKENIESYNGVDVIPFSELKEYIQSYTD